MKKAKWRIEYTSPHGEKISIALEGNFDPVKIKQLLDLIELFSNSSMSHFIESSSNHTSMSHTSMLDDDVNRGSLKERLILLLNKRFRNMWFTSKDVASAFFEEYGEIIPVNIVATYLARFHYSGMLIRRGSRAKWKYRISPELVSREESNI